MAQMAGFDFSVVTPAGAARRRPTPEDLEQEQQRILAEANAARWTNEPVTPTELDIAPEAPAVLEAVQTPLPGAIEPNVQAVLDERGEPPLPVKADEDLPPVTPEAGLVDGFDFSNVQPAAAPQAPASDGFDFSQVMPVQAEAEPEVKQEEIKLPAAKSPLQRMGTAPDDQVKAALTPAKPVTTPEAADGSDVKFEKDGPAFQFTGALVMEPETGPTAGIDGMRAVRPQGPVANAMNPAALEPALNRRPRLVPTAGQIVFDQSSPERFTQGVEEAFAAGILPQSNYEKIKASTAEIFKVVEERRKLEEKAQQDPKLLAFLQGARTGTAMLAGGTAGALGGAALGAMTGPAAPIAAPVGAIVGGIAGGIGAGLGYDELSKVLARHFETFDNSLKAAELEPMYNNLGKLTMAAVALPVSGVQAARGLRTAYEAGGMAQAARTGATAAGLGAGTGAVAYPIDAAVRGEEITPGGLATAAATGALMGGFFINNRLARTPEVARVFDKVQRGQKLTAAEETLFRSASGPIESVVRRGQMDGQRMTDIQVEVPQTSVMGMMPAAGRARVQVMYESPARLPEGAVRAAQNFAASRPARPTGPAPAAAAEAAPVPREAPVNIIPPGETIIPPPPMTPAMMTPDAFADAMATERGLDMDFNPEATTELFAEHFRVVRDAVNNNQPVSSAALDLYEMRVPYYVRDEETGLAVFDQPSFDAWQRYVSGQADEVRQDAREAGAIELLDAIRELGGLPSPRSGKSKAVWSGELKSLWETSRGGRDIGVKGVMNLWRNDAPDLDVIAMGLKQKGFRVETEADLIELLDNRLRSGREVFGYPVVADDRAPIGARAGRRPRGAAPGAPRQGELLGEADVEFTLTGQTDRTSLTPEEMASAQRAADEKAKADAAQGMLFGDAEGPTSTDPLTVPPQFKAAGGGAKVPPGQPSSMGAAAGAPDWVLQPGETSDGRRLIKGIQNFRPGQRWGFRTIVDFVNKAVNVEIRYSRSQTSRVHPAHYKPAHHMGYTRDTQSQIVFHEAGHGLEELLRSRAPQAIQQFATELIGLTQRPGSMASDPPSSASAAEKRDYEIGEGIAEWTRLLMVDPSAVQGLKFTAAVNQLTAQSFPKLAAALRDGARAVHAFQEKPAAERLMMFDAMPTANPSANEVLGGLIRMGDGFVNSLSSGARISKLDRTIFRAIVKNREQVGMTYQQALDRARQVRQKFTDPLLQAHNMILSIGQETQLAISGKGPSKGLRAVGPDGKITYFSKQAWVDMRRKIPGKKVAQFDTAAYALEALNRWKKGGLEYKGMREGLTPDQLELIVAQARKDIPKFDEMFAEQSAWFDAVVDLQDFGRLLKPGEREKILFSRDTYWPLPPASTHGRGRGGLARGNISTGLFRARGHSGPTRQVDEVAEERVRTALEAYYWNRFGLALYKNMLKVSSDRTLPIEARSLAGAQMVQLSVPQASVAKVSKEEATGWVLDAILDSIEGQIGFRPELKTDDINLAWNFKDVWRPTKPGDINVVSLLVDGERKFFQLGDPAIFGMFSNPQVASKAARFMAWALGPMTQNWKRNITQGPVFAIRNLFRDIFTQTILNPDPIAWIPGGTHILGTINKFTQKYPQVFQEGLLLSRVQPTEAELVKSVQSGAIWQWLSEGFYVSQAKDPVTKLLATVLNPSNLLFPLWKVGDVFNLVTGGRALAQFFETAGREGAAVSVLRRGGTDEEALLKYWTAAGQFNEHAGVADARVVMSIPGFLNPMFQGTRNAMQKLSDPDPKVRGTAWTRMMVMIPLTFGTAAVAAYLSMRREDRDRERQRPVEDRMNFMDINGFGIPFPYGPEGVMASVVYNAVMDDLLSRPMKDADKTSLMLLKRVFDLGSPLQFLGPQFASINEAQMNWSNFRQRHIVSPWMVNLPASEQYYSTTPEFYVKLGQMFNYSPAKLQYIVQQAISRQADETIRLMESIDGGRPVQEAADVPFVGRLFVRDPIGFGSQAVRDADAIEDRLRLLNTRLQAKGYGMLAAFDKDGNPEYPSDRLSPDLKKLQVQLEYLQGLRQGLRSIDEWQAVGKAAALAGDYNTERNIRRAITDRTQATLIGNKDRIRVLDQALELLKQIPAAPPRRQAADYLERRF